jgi:hypothetical protein
MITSRMQLLSYFVAVGKVCSVYCDVVAAAKSVLCLHRVYRNSIYSMHAITALLPTYMLRTTAVTNTALYSFMCLFVYVMHLLCMSL